MTDNRLGVAAVIAGGASAAAALGGKTPSFAGNFVRTTLVETSQASLRISFAGSTRLPPSSWRDDDCL